jgi:O-acetylhomoserine/O-acetylserine sulfhydrylase-like pyridoxal-dependent enzyme
MSPQVQRPETLALHAVGIEHVDDIVADIERGLAATTRFAKAA